MKLDRRLLQRDRTARFYLGLTIALGLLAGVVVVGQARYLSRVISQVFLAGQSLAGVQVWLLLLLILALSRAGLVWASEITAQRAANRLKSDLRQRLTAHVLALGPAYTQGERSGELTNTVVEGVEALDAYIRQYIPQLALAALVPLTILVFVFPLDLTSAVILLLTAPLIPIFMALIGSTAKALTEQQWTSLSRMSAHFLDALQGLTTLKLLGRSREQIELIARISDQFRQTTMSVLRVAFLSALVLELVAMLSTAVVAVEVGLRLLYGHLPFEQALFVLILAPEFYMPLRLLGSHYHSGQAGLAAARRIFEVLETPLPTPATRAPRRTGVTGLRCDIQLDQVHYAYDAGHRPALNGLSCRIAAGQKTALVGPSGAGKSTVAQLLLRLIEPDRGRMTVDGIPLADFDMGAWRGKIAWVPQRPHLFHGSVADNIRLARPKAGPDEVVQAARLAHADRFIETLPQKYETLIGERGARLSGGQAQRIALARAFLKDAPFLILDEPSANLDPEQEALLQDAISRLMQNRTVLLIAHRLNTVFQADQILVLADGQVVETGSHASLRRQNGLYQRLVTAYGGTG